MEIGKKNFVDVRTDGRTPEFQSTRSSVGDDLKTEMLRRNGPVIKPWSHLLHDYIIT